MTSKIVRLSYCIKIAVAFSGTCLIVALLYFILHVATATKHIQPADPKLAQLLRMYMGPQTRFSEDTSLVPFSLHGVTYAVPRNYIVNMDNWHGGPQSLVAFEVTYPGFKPYSKDTAECLKAIPANHPKDCLPVRFFVMGETPVSDDERLANAQKDARGPKEGSFGFQMYEAGPDNARIETYVKKIASHLLMYSCLIYPDNGRGRNGDCSNESRLPSGNAIEYRFYLKDLDKAEQIDEGIRPLVESFTITGEKQ